MEFITVEQFKEQPIEVQKVFLEWWKPQSADLFKYKLLFNVVDCLCGETISPFNENYVVFKKDCIPLFTEGQLRKFIEDETNGVVKNTQWHIEDDEVSKRGYSIYLLRKNEYHVAHHYINLGEDLLQAYWKVACMIAKEEVDG
ncbi:hypothetical protein ACQPVP_15805 [Clostridium nigeriense]|uniref:hypothetical protein n=1 Tax=Clostridium nigeriense TaxID=1805470 RepID=UPI003D332E7B